MSKSLIVRGRFSTGLQRPQDAQLIVVSMRIGLPNGIVQSATIGVVSAFAIPFFVIILTAYFSRIPTFAFETLTGELGFLIGLRALVFRDITLMDNWNRFVPLLCTFGRNHPFSANVALLLLTRNTLSTSIISVELLKY